VETRGRRTKTDVGRPRTPARSKWEVRVGRTATISRSAWRTGTAASPSSCGEMASHRVTAEGEVNGAPGHQNAGVRFPTGKKLAEAASTGRIGCGRAGTRSPARAAREFSGTPSIEHIACSRTLPRCERQHDGSIGCGKPGERFLRRHQLIGRAGRHRNGKTLAIRTSVARPIRLPVFPCPPGSWPSCCRLPASGARVQPGREKACSRAGNGPGDPVELGTWRPAGGPGRSHRLYQKDQQRSSSDRTDPLAVYAIQGQALCSVVHHAAPRVAGVQRHPADDVSREAWRRRVMAGLQNGRGGSSPRSASTRKISVYSVQGFSPLAVFRRGPRVVAGIQPDGARARDRRLGRQSVRY